MSYYWWISMNWMGFVPLPSQLLTFVMCMTNFGCLYFSCGLRGRKGGFSVCMCHRTWQILWSRLLSGSDVFIPPPKPLPLVACILLNVRDRGEDRHCNTRTAIATIGVLHIRGYREEITVTAGRNNKELHQDCNISER